MKQYQNIPLTLTVAAILVASLSFIMPKNKEKYLRDRFWTQKTFAPSKYDVVILGDSRIYRGVSPDVIEKQLPGLKVFNFGYSNGGLNAEIFNAAEEKISPESKTRIMIVGISANCITGFTRNNEQYVQEKNRPREDIFERLYLNGLLYWFSATTPEELKQLLSNKDEQSYYNNEYYSNGYVKSEKFPADTMEAIPSYIQDYSNYKVKQTYIDELANKVEDWSNRGFLVVGFRPPTTVPMRALEDTMGLYNEELIKIKFTEAGGRWVHLEPGYFKTYDGSHLDVHSAVKLSEILADSIASYLVKK